MTFNLTLIVIFTVGGFIYSLILPKSWRKWTLFIASVLAVYALQPPLLIRDMDFIFPTITIFMAVFVWIATLPRTDNQLRIIIAWRDLFTIAILILLIIGLAMTRHLPTDLQILTASRPPDPLDVLLVLCPIALLIILAGGMQINQPRQRFALSLILLGIIGVFIALKTDRLSLALSGWLREQTGRDASLANPLTDLNWLGFSYVAFRLIHVLRDRQTGKLPNVSLRDMLTYIIFFPSLTSGPIDRMERFHEDLLALSQMNGRDPSRIVVGSTRIVIGIFKKFVVADSLALFALSITNVGQVTYAGGMWVLLYAYAFRLFFDFSGYTDIAIGIGMLFGVQLPENFNRPYLKNNITSFWQSWHITLSNWVRFYIFSPLTRRMLRWKRKPPSDIIVGIGLVITMVVIGLWHAIGPTFLVWGLWHATGLFIHKMWSDRTRKWYNQFKKKHVQLRLWNLAGMFITFHFVVIGWVWFVMPDLHSAFSVLSKLVGVGF